MGKTGANVNKAADLSEENLLSADNLSRYDYAVSLSGSIAEKLTVSLFERILGQKAQNGGALRETLSEKALEELESLVRAAEENQADSAALAGQADEIAYQMESIVKGSPALYRLIGDAPLSLFETRALSRLLENKGAVAETLASLSETLPQEVFAPIANAVFSVDGGGDQNTSDDDSLSEKAVYEKLSGLLKQARKDGEISGAVYKKAAKALKMSRKYNSELDRNVVPVRHKKRFTDVDMLVINESGVKEGNYTLAASLTLPALGLVNVTASVSGGEISVSVVCENDEAAAAIEKNDALLKDYLSEAGFASADVSVAGKAV
jgi:hypothetical protein